MFMSSHSGAIHRTAAAERPQIWLSTLQPDIVPALAANSLDKLERLTDPEEVVPEPTPQPVSPPPSVYRRVTIETPPVDWRQCYDFCQALVKPLVEAGAEVEIQVRLEASGEIDANLVDLSVKEGVFQLDARGNVKVEAQ